MSNFLAVARMIKIEHSVFALPFAYIGMFLGAGGWPGLWKFLALTAAVAAMRSYAMTYNRLADLQYDRINPRTKNRPLVTGEITLVQARRFCIGAAVVFVAACALLNSLCFFLSPIPLAVAAFYSYSKRFTWLCHFILGSVLGIAPLAGWLGVDPSALTSQAALLFFGVTFWVAGFDILYACLDVEFDRDQGLHSIPARFGIKSALFLSSFCHVNTCLFFLLAGLGAGLNWIYYVVWALVSAVLAYEHRLVSAEDLSRVNLAFFTLNGFVSIALFVGVLLALFV